MTSPFHSKTSNIVGIFGFRAARGVGANRNHNGVDDAAAAKDDDIDDDEDSIDDDLDPDAPEYDGYTNDGQSDDYMRFTGDILGYAAGAGHGSDRRGGGGGGGGNNGGYGYESRTWPTGNYGGGGGGGWQRPPSASSSSPSQLVSSHIIELAPNSGERDDQRTRDLEGMFAKGVRGLLTSYMQRALQPAIKETLMESLGYRTSYG